MKIAKKKSTFSIILVCIAIILLSLYLGITLYDKYSDKTKVFKNAGNIIKNEYQNIENNILSSGLKISKPFNADVTISNAGEKITFNAIYKDSNNYQITVPINNNTVTYSIQDNKMYYKKNNDIYDYNASENELFEIKNIVNEYFSDNNNDNIDIISNLEKISNSIDNKKILKNRVKTNINDKNIYVSKYTYKIDNESLKEVLFIDNKTDIEYELNVYAKFNSIKKLEIPGMLEIIFYDDYYLMNYYSHNIKNEIIYNKKENKINYTSYNDNVKYLEYSASRIDNFNVSTTIYNNDSTINYNFQSIDNTDNHYLANLNINGNEYNAEITLYPNTNTSLVSKDDAKILNDIDKQMIEKETNDFINESIIGKIKTDFGM